jgi:glutamyl-tRNA synthetase
MPLLRNNDKSKISKRKNPTSLAYYRRAGILPGAMVNFLALMGWSFGGDQEVFSVPEMIERFEITNVHLGGPIFDQAKLSWLNQQYMMRLTDDAYVDYMYRWVIHRDYLRKVVPLLKERCSRFDEFFERGAFFFGGVSHCPIDAILPKGKTLDEVKPMVSGLLEKLDELYEWETTPIHDALEAYRVQINWKAKDYFMPIRMIITGRKDSPPLAESLEVVGREMVRYRLRDFLGRNA